MKLGVLVPFPRFIRLGRQLHKALSIYDPSSSSMLLNLSAEQEQSLIENGFTLFRLLHDEYENDGGSMKERRALDVSEKVGMIFVSLLVVEEDLNLRATSSVDYKEKDHISKWDTMNFGRASTVLLR